MLKIHIPDTALHQTSVTCRLTLEPVE